jgi:hypothetical protein
MKTKITIILIMCVFDSLRGQEWTVTKSDTICTSVDSLFMELDELLFISDLKQAQPLLRLWDRYEKECYKDSTDILWLDGGGYDRSVERVDYLMLNSEDVNRIIIKRIPEEPTPQGFLEWLKKQ